MSPPKRCLSAAGTPKPPPEKSKFLQTCNRLSLFLKEKGNLRDLNLGINSKFDADGTALFNSVRSLKLPNPNPTDAEAKPKPPPTVDLLSTIGEKTSEIIPQYVCSSELADKISPAGEPKTAQMTIFYQGEVMVLDDVPADRARDLMLMAKNGSKDVSRSKEPVKPEVQGKDSDLPIARRASLHKFLAKRKDRATVRAPAAYQSPGGSSSGNEHSFDLNL